uniref:Mitochondrial import inner membrane translocase subunit n=1 Tax=Sciurus vulgaris TaxID=55149 RepID=A0A8D2ATZ1_SCIVU
MKAEKESDQIKEFRKFLGTYNKLTETCCLDCVKDFTTREVKPEEIIFSEHLKMLQRISMRFQEYRIPQNEALAAKAGLLLGHLILYMYDYTNGMNLCVQP